MLFICPRERAVYKFRKTIGKSQIANKNIVREHIKTQKVEVKIMADELRNEQAESENLENQQEATEQKEQTTEQKDGQQEESKETEQKEPTVQELMAELAKEKIDLEKAEREAERDEQFQQLVRENKINKVEKSYLALGYTAEEAAKMAVAEVDEDFDAKLKIQLAVQKRQKKEYEAEFIKSRPQLNAGAGDKQLTKEQFDNMGLAEKSKLFRENEAEYNRLNSMK